LRHERPIAGDHVAATQSLQESPVAPNPYASPAPPTDVHLNRTFSLSTMFLWTTLVAVVMGVAGVAPGLAILLAILSLPAALRTIGMVGRRTRQSGRSPTVGEKVELFAASLGIVFVIFIGAAAAFTATCFPLGLAGFAANGENMSGAFIIAILVGIVAGAIAAYFLIRALWRTGN
jgi:hypothetical protein